MNKSFMGASTVLLATILLTGCSIFTKGMKCDYTDKDNKQGIAYIKDNMFYMMTTGGILSNKSIGIDDKLYVRSNKSVTGIVMDLTTKDMIDFVLSNGKCTKENVSDSLFTLPNDKVFSKF